MTDKPQPETETKEDHEEGTDDGPKFPLSRRMTLGLLSLGGLAHLGGRKARAASPDDGSAGNGNSGGAVYNWKLDVDARGHELSDLGALAMVDNQTAITDFAGSNLSIDAGGVLNATDTDTDTHTAVSNDGAQVVESVDDIDFTTGLNATDDGDGTASVGLTDDSISVVAEDHLIGGGSATLGESIALSVSDDWVNITGDTMLGDLDLGSNDLRDGGTTIWDATNAHVPADRVQTAGLDADTLDGNHAADLQPSVSDDDAEVVEDVEEIVAGANLSATDAGGGTAVLDFDGDGLDADTLDGRDDYWHPGNDGAGSELDADTVDGEHASAFADANHDHGGEQWNTDSFNGLAVKGGADGINGHGGVHGIIGEGGVTGVIGEGPSRGVIGRSDDIAVKGEGGTYGVYGQGDVFGLYTPDDASVQGNLHAGTILAGHVVAAQVSANAKTFVQSVETPDGERMVVYTSVEAPTPRTEVSGIDTLESGRAKIDLPDHFGWVTSREEPLIVQATPYGDARLRVTERSVDRIVVEAIEGPDCEFAYTVKGTRAGFEEESVVREPNETLEAASPQ